MSIGEIRVDPQRLRKLGEELHDQVGLLNNNLTGINRSNEKLMNYWKSEAGLEYSKEVSTEAEEIERLINEIDDNSEYLKKAANNYQTADENIRDSIRSVSGREEV